MEEVGVKVIHQMHHAVEFIFPWLPFMLHAVAMFNYPIYAILRHNSWGAVNSVHAVPSFFAWLMSHLPMQGAREKGEWIPVEPALGWSSTSPLAPRLLPPKLSGEPAANYSSIVLLWLEIGSMRRFEWWIKMATLIRIGLVDNEAPLSIFI